MVLRDIRTGRRRLSARQTNEKHVYGYYTSRGERRTTLQDMLEDDPLLEKGQLELVMNYLRSCLDSSHQFYQPVRTSGYGAIISHFGRFSELPKELQLLIWRKSLPSSRILEFSGDVRKLATPSSAKASQLAVANIARACRDAKEIVDKRYQKPFINKLGGKSKPFLSGSYFVDLEHDIQFFVKSTGQNPICFCSHIIMNHR